MSNASPRPIPTGWLGTIQHDLPYDDYRQLDGINAHGLMDVLKSPAAHRAALQSASSPPSPSMLTGILFEMALLEPQKFEDSVVVGTARAAKLGQTAITPSHMDKLSGMLTAVRANQHAVQALASVQVQPVALWQDEKHGVPCKARLDAIASFGGGQRIALDIKTARAASAADFSRAAAQFRYDLQAAHYLEAGAATGAYSAEVFLFIVVQNTAPYSCFVYEAGEQMLARGRAWRREAMALYSQCRQENDWPGEPAFQTLELPRWAPWPKEPSDGRAEEQGLSDPPDLD